MRMVKTRSVVASDLAIVTKKERTTKENYDQCEPKVVTSLLL